MARIAWLYVGRRQTPLGIFHNLLHPRDCGGIRYLNVHLGPWRLELTWRWPWSRAAEDEAR